MLLPIFGLGVSANKQVDMSRKPVVVPGKGPCRAPSRNQNMLIVFYNEQNCQFEIEYSGNESQFDYCIYNEAGQCLVEGTEILDANENATFDFCATAGNEYTIEIRIDNTVYVGTMIAE